MPGSLVSTHIPNANHAYLLIGDERGECPNSASLDGVINSVTWSGQYLPNWPRFGLLSRGNISDPDWTLYSKMTSGGILYVGLQDTLNRKLIFRSNDPIGGDIVPIEITFTWNHITKTFGLYKNAAPQGFVLDGASTTTPASFGQLIIPSGDKKWYFGWVDGEPLFQGIYYGDVLDDVAWTPSEVFTYVNPRLYTGTTPNVPHIYFSSSRARLDGNSDLFKMAETGLKIQKIATAVSNFNGTAMSVNSSTKDVLAFDGAHSLVLVPNSGGVIPQYSRSSYIGAGFFAPYSSPAWANNTTYVYADYRGGFNGGSYNGTGHEFIPFYETEVRNSLWEVTVSGNPYGDTPSSLIRPSIAPDSPYRFHYPLTKSATGITKINSNPLTYAAVIPSDITNSYNLLTIVDANASGGVPNQNNVFTNDVNLETITSVIDSEAYPGAIVGVIAHIPTQKLIWAKKPSGGQYNIFITDLPSGGTITQLTFSGNNFVGGFSPDGSEIVFTSDRTGVDQVWKMSVTGANQRNLSDNSYIEIAGGWA